MIIKPTVFFIRGLIALLSYPFLLEPWIGLQEQQLIWSMGFSLLGLMVLGCMIMLHLKQRQAASRIELAATKSEPPRLGLQLRWLALSLVPSSFCAVFRGGALSQSYRPAVQ